MRLFPIPAIYWVAAVRAVRRTLLTPLSVADFVERIPTRIRMLEFLRQDLQALQRFAALTATLEHLGIADQSVQVRLFGFEVLNFPGQLCELALLVI